MSAPRLPRLLAYLVMTHRLLERPYTSAPAGQEDTYALISELGCHHRDVAPLQLPFVQLPFVRVCPRRVFDGIYASKRAAGRSRAHGLLVQPTSKISCPCWLPLISSSRFVLPSSNAVRFRVAAAASDIELLPSSSKPQS